MKTTTAKITIPAEQWQAYLKLKADKTSSEKAFKALEKAWNLPNPADIVGEGEKASFVIVDGNGQPQGKASYYWHSGMTVPPSARRRLT